MDKVDMRGKLNDYILSVKGFNGSVLAALNGEVFLMEGYGYADPVNGIRNTPYTHYPIASVTKPMTALSVMRLAERKLISLSDPIDGFLPGLFEGKGITIHQLLSQTSGISNDFSHQDIRGATEKTALEIVGMMSAKPLKYKPGTKWCYSNTNYMLLSLIIEKVSKMPFHDYIKEYVFKPAGMEHSGFYDEMRDNLAVHGKGVFECSPAMIQGAGDVVTNVEDLFKFDQALYTDSIASRQSIDKTREMAYNGRMIKYGYGWFLRRLFGRSCVSCGGFHPVGYTSHLERYPEEKLTIIVLSNSLSKYSRLGLKYFGSTDLSRELAARFFGKRVNPLQKMF